MLEIVEESVMTDEEYKNHKDAFDKAVNIIKVGSMGKIKDTQLLTLLTFTTKQLIEFYEKAK